MEKVCEKEPNRWWKRQRFSTTAFWRIKRRQNKNLSYPLLSTMNPKISTLYNHVIHLRGIDFLYQNINGSLKGGIGQHVILNLLISMKNGGMILFT